MIDEGRGHEPADQVARDVARDVGGESTGRVGGAAFLAEVGQRQREGRGHEDALHDAQQREGAEPGRHRQQRRRYRQQREADKDPQPAVDLAGEQRDGEAGHRHPHGAGVDRKTHRGRAHLIVAHQRGQDGLGGEQVDHRQEGREPDHQLAQQGAACATARVYRRHQRGCVGGRCVGHGVCPFGRARESDPSRCLCGFRLSSSEGSAPSVVTAA